MKRTALVVDDEQGFRDMFTFFLEPLGFEVTCVENGQKGVDKIQEKEYDIVLMDMHMPVLTGPEAVKKVRAIRPGQKIIILSSCSDPNLTFESQVEEAGIVACLYKPAELEAIERALEKALGPLSQPL